MKPNLQGIADNLLKPRYFRRDTRKVAKALVGKLLVRSCQRRLIICRITETEAYLPSNDSACHASRKKTPRNSVMFDAGGAIYVYSIHARYCFNIVTEDSGSGCAVLIRSAEPLQDIEFMCRNRSTTDEFNLLSGPAKLCEALQIDKALNGQRLGRKSGLWISDDGQRAPEIVTTPRIGVTSAFDLPLRFVAKGSPYASGPKRMR